MTTNDYESYVLAMSKPYTDPNYCAIALAEEAGEVCGWYKKMILRGNPTGKLTTDDLKSELGDVLFYLTRMASHYNWPLTELMDFNKAKLDVRAAKGKVVG